MKPFLGIDLTTDRKNTRLNGDDFLVARPSPAMAQALKNTTQKADQTISASKLPLPLRIVQWVCGAVGLLVATGIVRALPEVSVQQAYRNAAVLFWISGICLLIWGVLKLLSLLKQRSVLGVEENTRVFSNLERVRSAVYSEMAVPADAKKTDILSFYYKMKDGKIKVCEKGMQMASHFNPEYRIFADSENLYIANLEGKYAFPLTTISSIRTVKKHIRIAGWNKDEAFDKGIYKQYKLTRDNYGCIHCKSYHIIEINHNGESWGIWFPCYELPVFEAVTKRYAP